MAEKTPTADPAQTIECDDTVRLVGRTGKGTVTSVEPTRIEIMYQWRTRDRVEHVRIHWYARERVELVRKGNKLDDDVKAFLEEVDGMRAKEAGQTLEDYRAAALRRQEAEHAAWLAENAKVAELRAAAAERRAQADRDEAARRAAEVVAAAGRAAEEERIMAAAAEFNARHTAAHGGDFLESLMCMVGKEMADASCPQMAGAGAEGDR